MEKFEDYIKNGKRRNRTLEESMLAFCKVVADEKDLPIKKLNKDEERLRLKEAREDSENNEIVQKFRKERLKNIFTLKKYFKILMRTLELSGDIDENKFKELLNKYRVKHLVPNFFKTIRYNNHKNKQSSFEKEKLLKRINDFKNKIIQDTALKKENYDNMYKEKNELKKTKDSLKDTDIDVAYEKLISIFNNWNYVRQH